MGRFSRSAPYGRAVVGAPIRNWLAVELVHRTQERAPTAQRVGMASVCLDSNTTAISIEI